MIDKLTLVDLRFYVQVVELSVATTLVPSSFSSSNELDEMEVLRRLCLCGVTVTIGWEAYGIVTAWGWAPYGTCRSSGDDDTDGDARVCCVLDAWASRLM